ncbi:BspA family leucine-rich repeat surface protein [Helicobacter japonicus]|uniref:BspA family leucine-rich repeat surface protein n=1 Tax=Helicobacter japonicus TaxID=425400 RepID=UPI0023F21B6D|nr:BspA family leucine-rich repeat surface protein [Helicobacter japonicus]
MLQENISEEAIIAYLKANIKNAKKEIEAALKHIQNCAYEMTMQADYEEYELEYEDETGIPASECDTAHFQRWFEDKLLDEDLAKIRTLLEELMNEKDLQQRLNSQANAHSAQSPKELIEAIQNYEVLKALHILQSGQIEKKHIGKDLLKVCDKAIDALIDVIVEDSKGGKDIGKGIKGAFSRFIEVDYNRQGYKDYSGETRKQLKKGSVYKLREILESITKGESIESALHNSVFYDKKGNFKPKHKELSFIPLNTFELKVLVEIEEVHLGQIDLSYIKSLAALFADCAWWWTNRKDFSGIEQWDTSKINDMCKLFVGLKDFKADLSKWNVSSVKNFESMFEDCESFESDLSKWNPKKAEDIAFMFSGAKSFTSNLDAWNLSQGVVENAKYLFENCPLSQTPPSWYKAVFDMDNPSVALLYKLVKIRDYTRAKECLLKLQTLSKEEYIECARLCFYLPRGVVGTALPDKDFFTALVNQAKSQNIVIPISNEVMQKCLRYGELEYAKYLVTLGYKVTIDKENNFGVCVALKSGPTQKVRDILHFFVENLGNEINEEFFEALFGDSPGFVRDFKQETLDIFFKELLSCYPRETFTNKKVLSCLINVGLIRILFKNGIEVDLQGVAYNPRVIKHYLDKDLQTFLKLLELHLLQADSIIEYYIYYPRDTFVKVSVLLVFVDEFKNKLMRMPMQAILKQFAKNGIDVEKLGTYEGKNLYEILEDSEHKEEILSLLKIK